MFIAFVWYTRYSWSSVLFSYYRRLSFASLTFMGGKSPKRKFPKVQVLAEPLNLNTRHFTYLFAPLLILLEAARVVTTFLFNSLSVTHVVIISLPLVHTIYTIFPHSDLVCRFPRTRGSTSGQHSSPPSWGPLPNTLNSSILGNIRQCISWGGLLLY